MTKSAGTAFSRSFSRSDVHLGRLLSIIRSLDKNMKGTVVFDGSTSDPFDIRSGVKQGCVLAPTLSGIFLAVLLKHAFGSATEDIYLRNRYDGKLFNLFRLRAMSKVELKYQRDFLFLPMTQLSLPTQLRASNSSRTALARPAEISDSPSVMGEDVNSPPSNTISDHKLEVVHDFVYLGSTISDTLSLDSELNTRIGKAATPCPG